MKKVVIYGRNSIATGNPENQLIELRNIAKKNDWVVIKEYVDVGISGNKSRHQRPQFDAMLNSAMRKDFDLVMFWSVDRASRNLTHLVQMMTDLDSKNIGLYFHQQSIDTSTPSGRAMIQMAGVFAEFERSMLRERILASHERAKLEGKSIGRPSQVNDAMIKSVNFMREKGTGIKKIAKDLQIGVGTVYKIIENRV